MGSYVVSLARICTISRQKLQQWMYRNEMAGRSDSYEAKSGAAEVHVGWPKSDAVVDQKKFLAANKCA